MLSRHLNAKESSVQEREIWIWELSALGWYLNPATQDYLGSQGRKSKRDTSLGESHYRLVRKKVLAKKTKKAKLLR